MDNSIFSSFNGSHKMITRYKKQYIRKHKNDRIMSDSADEDYDPSKDKFSSNFHIAKEKIYGRSKIFIGN